MKKYYITLLFVITCSVAFGQRFNASLSGKHLKKVERGKSAKQKLKRYHKFYTKDSLKQVRKDKKYWKHKSDSLTKAIAKGEHLQLPDTLNIDSLSSALAENAPLDIQNEELERLSSLNGEAGNYRDALKDQESTQEFVESEATKSLGQNNELSQLGQQKEEVQQLTTMPDTYKQELEGYKEEASSLSDKEKQQEIAKARAEAFLTENATQLKLLDNAISVLQNKYSKVLNSGDMSSAVKRSSLKGKPLRERLFIGGNFNITSTDPFALDLTPQLGYKFNRKFIIGAGFVYRKTFSSDSIDLAGVPENATGYNIFTSYDVLNGFFAYSEFNQLSISKSENDMNSTTSVTGILAGIGRRFTVHKMIDMNIMLLYNFLHEPGTNALNSSPWSFKFGFSVSELGLLK